jgi:hypothetical protein
MVTGPQMQTRETACLAAWYSWLILWSLLSCLRCPVQVCECVCAHTHECVQVCVHMCAHVCVYNTHVCVQACVQVCVSICLYVSVHAGASMHVYV